MFSTSYPDTSLYQTSYPLNLPSDSYFANDYLSDPTNQFLSDLYQPTYNTALDPFTNNFNLASQNAPVPLPRKNNNYQPAQNQQYAQQSLNQQQRANQQNLNTSQQSNRSFDSSVRQINSPTSLDGDDEPRDDSMLVKAYENQRQYKNNPNAPTTTNNQNNNNNPNNNMNNNNASDEERQRQEVWDKLQKTKQDSKNKSNSSNNLSKKPPLNTNSSRKNPPSYSKPENSNYIEDNIVAIRNKENIVHRYPQKNYENIHTKVKEPMKFRSHSDTIKKPPHYVDPMESKGITLSLSDGKTKYQSNSANLETGNGPSKTISIPLNSNIWKDNDRINLDISLRLVDFLNAQNGNANSFMNRSLDEFQMNDPNLDPLDRHIKKFESKITRSLPGSSGSLNKFKPLPPLNNSFNAPGQKLQHEFDYDRQENDGYLANMYKSNAKPTFKQYTMSDYRNFKKDTGITSTKSTGKLGFDFDNELYKEKLDKAQKRVDYAQRVKARNTRVISEQKKSPLEFDQPISNEKSKTQRV